MEKKSPIKILIFVLIGILLLGAVFTSIFKPTSVDACNSVPEGGFIKIESGVYTVDGTDRQVHILRGIALGAPDVVVTDSVTTIPACFSNEPGLVTYKNLFLIDSNGNRIAMVKGVGGNDATKTATAPLK